MALANAAKRFSITPDPMVASHIRGVIEMLEDPEHLPRTPSAYRNFLEGELAWVKERTRLLAVRLP
jgi:hypothetical protein